MRGVARRDGSTLLCLSPWARQALPLQFRSFAFLFPPWGLVPHSLRECSGTMPPSLCVHCEAAGVSALDFGFRLSLFTYPFIGVHRGLNGLALPFVLGKAGLAPTILFLLGLTLCPLCPLCTLWLISLAVRLSYPFKDGASANPPRRTKPERSFRANPNISRTPIGTHNGPTIFSG